MKRLLPNAAAVVLMTVAASIAAAQDSSGETQAGRENSDAETRLRDAQEAVQAATKNVQAQSLALLAAPNDIGRRRRFYKAMDQVMDASKNLDDARAQPSLNLQEQRYLSAHNESSKYMSLWVQIYSKTPQGGWAWKSAATSEGKFAAEYHLDPGKSINLDFEGHRLAGSKIRFWVKWAGGEFNVYRTRDLQLISEAEGGAHVYRAAAMQTYPLRLKP